jgi:hypothetical protein
MLDAINSDNIPVRFRMCLHLYTPKYIPEIQPFTKLKGVHCSVRGEVGSCTPFCHVPPVRFCEENSSDIFRTMEEFRPLVCERSRKPEQ